MRNKLNIPNQPLYAALLLCYTRVVMQIYSDKIFSNPVKIIKASGRKNLLSSLDEIWELRKEYYLLGYITYEFDKLYFEVYNSYDKFEPREFNDRYGIIRKNLISYSGYCDNFNKIKEYIKNGVTYEVNYTYPFEVISNLSDYDLYCAILQNQKTKYNAFLKSDDYTILSYSPELFFKIDGNKIITKPMKGTMPRGAFKAEDDNNRKFLKSDIKNRAENIMIVDLLRNDLSQIAKTGSVVVDKLFEIEEHKTVFQMISQVSAILRSDINLRKIFEAIFPCGSITGAPKVSTMRVIKELEKYSRGVYCGAIGFLSPNECEFSVPIRILQKHKNGNFNCHVGGAIVYDSDENKEWQETLVKAAFLKGDFYLIETAVDDWDLHVERMKKSAEVLGFAWNSDIEKIKLKKDFITRVILYKNGEFQCEERKIIRSKTNKVKICGTVNSSNPFLYHKTNIRNDYEILDYFDYIQTNEKGEITEGTFTNVAILKNGIMYTPPVKCGLLAGVYRDKLIKSGKLKEKVLYSHDLQNAEKIFCFNSVRKMVEVELC